MRMGQPTGRVTLGPLDPSARRLHPRALETIMSAPMHLCPALPLFWRSRVMRRFLVVPAVLVLLFAPFQSASGQSLASKLEELLLFGDCGGRLCLLLDPLNNHADHYTADAAAAGDLVIGFCRGDRD